VRQNNAAKWYSSGHDYFWALSELLESAEETIFILDWCVLRGGGCVLLADLVRGTAARWLTPELYLRRPSHLHEDFRLDRILKRKAEQGVAIRIVVYKEVSVRSWAPRRARRQTRMGLAAACRRTAGCSH